VIDYLCVCPLPAHRHKKNEVFLDVVESVNLLVNSNGTLVVSEVRQGGGDSRGWAGGGGLQHCWQHQVALGEEVAAYAGSRAASDYGGMCCHFHAWLVNLWCWPHGRHCGCPGHGTVIHSKLLQGLHQPWVPCS
jgi:hypothetical protein